jgi:SnoaL-like domain
MTIRRISAQRNSEMAQFAGSRLRCHKGMFGWRVIIFLTRSVRWFWSATSKAEEGRAGGAAFQRGTRLKRGQQDAVRWRRLESKAGGLKYRRPALQVVVAARSILWEIGALRLRLAKRPPSKNRGWGTQALLGLVAVSGIFGLAMTASAQEIRLEKCDALPVVDVLVAGEHTTLLVDTAATSMLNLKSFAAGKAKDIRVTSWSGTLATSAKEITLGEVMIGNTKLVGLKLPAIDLSSIGEACGRKIDGILGADLIAKLGATIDLKKQSMHVTTADEERAARLAAEMHREMHGCLEAFNHSDEAEFGECLDPKIVLFTMNTELYGRKQVVGYFRDKYFHQTPAAKLELSESAFHAVGDAVWYEYEFTIESALGLLRGRGVAMCQKSDGRWRMASMHHSAERLEPAVAAR